MSHALTLHIGLPKTATTFLQQEVFPKLTRHGFVDRPKTRHLQPLHGPDDGFLFARALSREAAVWDSLGPTLLDEVLGEERGERPVLVSDEGIGRTASCAPRLAEHLRRIETLARARGFSGLKIILVVREQMEWLASHYAQRSNVKARAGQKDFEAFLRHQTDPAGGFYRFGSLLQYDVILAALLAQFDRSDILLLPYERLREHQTEFVTAITDFIADEAEGLKAAPPRNTRGAGEARWVLRPPSPTRPVRWARFQLGGDDARFIRLTPALREAGSVYADHNAALERLAEIDLGRYGYALTR